HSMMNFEVRVVQPNDFKAYLQYREENPNATNADALRTIGQEPLAVTTRPFESRRGEQVPQASK
ncbi:MAG: cytochrome C oxidase subunit II, partial [Mycobacterium sp.]